MPEARSNGTLVDSSVVLDVATRDPAWFDWSSQALASAVRGGPVILNPIVYAEVAIGYERIEDLDDALPPEIFRREPLPFAAAFLAGKAHRAYRGPGGPRTTTLPDFFIGAHAAVGGLALLTRDPRRVRSTFPTVRLIAPPG